MAKRFSIALTAGVAVAIILPLFAAVLVRRQRLQATHAAPSSITCESFPDRLAVVVRYRDRESGRMFRIDHFADARGLPDMADKFKVVRLLGPPDLPVNYVKAGIGIYSDEGHETRAVFVTFVEKDLGRYPIEPGSDYQGFQRCIDAQRRVFEKAWDDAETLFRQAESRPVAPLVITLSNMKTFVNPDAKQIEPNTKHGGATWIVDEWMSDPFDRSRKYQGRAHWQCESGYRVTFPVANFDRPLCSV